MQTARMLGKIAQQSNINAPTLDVDMSMLLEGSEIFKRVQLLAQWWEGWYDGLHEQVRIYDESIARFTQS
ncbi:hypothetical protein TDB9533_02526 [Thalassocella blandensis]|nr:hypothetical protein TDB9533_02526 [Thalassocella blandensis]